MNKSIFKRFCFIVFLFLLCIFCSSKVYASNKSVKIDSKNNLKAISLGTTKVVANDLKYHGGYSEGENDLKLSFTAPKSGKYKFTLSNLKVTNNNTKPLYLQFSVRDKDFSTVLLHECFIDGRIYNTVGLRYKYDNLVANGKVDTSYKRWLLDSSMMYSSSLSETVKLKKGEKIYFFISGVGNVSDDSEFLKNCSFSLNIKKVK